MCLFAGAAMAQSPQPAVTLNANTQGPDLDLSIRYYSRVRTQEGVLRENRYEEEMLRRPGHVWTARVLSPALSAARGDEHGAAGHAPEGKGAAKNLADERMAGAGEPHDHKQFNHVVLPRHVRYDGGKTHVEFVDAHERVLIYIAPTEYENVDFDGSWANTFYLIDPQGVATLPRSGRVSAVAGAHWHEREKNGLFQRVLWDDNKMIPLIVESGDRAGVFFKRIEIKPKANLAKVLPWQNLKGYGQKEYSDFLD